MKNAEEILGYSFLAVLVVAAILITVFTSPSLGNYMYGRKPGEHFDKTRMPRYIATVVLTAVISLVYSFAIARQYKLTLQFTAGTTFYVAVACIKLILYKQDK